MQTENEATQFEPLETNRCPVHGVREVVRKYMGRGADPLEVQVLECGDKLTWNGEFDQLVGIDTRQRRRFLLSEARR